MWPFNRTKRYKARQAAAIAATAQRIADDADNAALVYRAMRAMMAAQVLCSIENSLRAMPTAEGQEFLDYARKQLMKPTEP